MALNILMVFIKSHSHSFTRNWHHNYHYDAVRRIKRSSEGSKLPCQRTFVATLWLQRDLLTSPKDGFSFSFFFLNKNNKKRRINKVRINVDIFKNFPFLHHYKWTSMESGSPGQPDAVTWKWHSLKSYGGESGVRFMAPLLWLFAVKYWHLLVPQGHSKRSTHFLSSVSFTELFGLALLRLE